MVVSTYARDTLEDIRAVVLEAVEVATEAAMPPSDMNGTGLETRLRNIMLTNISDQLGQSGQGTTVSLESRANNRYQSYQTALDGIDTMISAISTKVV